MPKIKILSEQVANQIAAGEVVDRPASVVKEFIDNSIDANATEIVIRLEEGGIKRIEVADNGEGIEKEDLQTAVKRHGTSKIATSDDLSKISSMGFRGEALASIAAVSRLSLRSKISNSDAGYELRVIGGEEKEIKPVGMPQGTYIIVEDLFFNVPARKKFMRQPQTELRHVMQVVTDSALMFPEIHLSVYHNQRLLAEYRKTKVREQRIKDVLGTTFFDQLIPLHFDHPHLQISGFIAKPQLAHQAKNKQFLFVNQRSVQDKSLGKTLRDAYGSLLPPKIYPAYLIFVSLPPEHVDVNIHPRKEEVKFVSTQLVYSSLHKAVRHALDHADLTFEHLPEVDEPQTKPSTGTSSEVMSPSLRNVDATPAHQDRKFSQARSATNYINEPVALSYQKVEPVVAEPQRLWQDTEQVLVDKEAEILQVHNVYLITQTEEGILLVDQHAAHERMLFEKFSKQFSENQKKGISQPLLVPEPFSLPFAEKELLKGNMEVFTKLGFEFESKDDTFVINAVPALLVERNAKQVITEVLHDIGSPVTTQSFDSQSQKILTYLSCRSAVKAGDELSLQERQHILQSLSNLDEQYTCPHGRPLKIHLSLAALDKMFKRTGF